MMNSKQTGIIVFGGTGKSGIQLLKRGVDKNLKVTAFVRNPNKIPKDIRDKLHKIVTGDVLDVQGVEDAIQGNRFVLSALGTGMNLGATTLISEGCRNIIQGMKKHNVRKLAVISVAFLLPGRSPFFLLKKVTEDHARQLEILKHESENIDWIAMMAPGIRDDSTVRSDYQVEKDKIPGMQRVTTADMSDFMISLCKDEALEREYRHCMLGISSVVNACSIL